MLWKPCRPINICFVGKKVSILVQIRIFPQKNKVWKMLKKRNSCTSKTRCFKFLVPIDKLFANSFQNCFKHKESSLKKHQIRKHSIQKLTENAFAIERLTCSGKFEVFEKAPREKRTACLPFKSFSYS